MFRYIVFACLLQFSIGKFIRGRVFIDGSTSRLTSMPKGSNLAILLQETSLVDAPATNLQEIKILNIASLPFYYQIEVPTSVIPGLSYSLSARVTKGDELLYINDRRISIPIEDSRPMILDIPVINVKQDNIVQTTTVVNEEQLSWPHLVGVSGTYAVEEIKRRSGLTNVFVVPEDSPITMDYRTDRVRVFVNKKGIVTRVPTVG